MPTRCYNDRWTWFYETTFRYALFDCRVYGLISFFKGKVSRNVNDHWNCTVASQLFVNRHGGLLVKGICESDTIPNVLVFNLNMVIKYLNVLRNQLQTKNGIMAKLRPRRISTPPIPCGQCAPYSISDPVWNLKLHSSPYLSQMNLIATINTRHRVVSVLFVVFLTRYFKLISYNEPEILLTFI